MTSVKRQVGGLTEELQEWPLRRFGSALAAMPPGFALTVISFLFTLGYAMSAGSVDVPNVFPVTGWSHQWDKPGQEEVGA